VIFITILKCNFSKEKRQRPKVLTHIPILPGTVLDDFERNIQICEALFARLEAMEKSDVLSETGSCLLIEIVEAARVLSLKSALGTILRSELDPSTVTGLTTAVIKLGRYSTAASFLVRAAEELSIFAQIEISVIKLTSASDLLIVEPQNFVQGVLNGTFDTLEAEKAAIDINSRLEQKYPRKFVLSDISSTKFAVHAEIQLLFYYELQPTALPPRLICSSKKACFLCSLFVELYGKFIIPSSHGKLYEKWTLPKRMDELRGGREKRIGAVMDRFNDAVEDELRLEVRTVRRPYQSPLESAIFPSAVWSSSHRSQSTSPSTLSQATSTAKSTSPLEEQPAVHQDLRQDILYAQCDLVAPIYKGSEDTSGDPLKNTNCSIAKSRESLLDSPLVTERSKGVPMEKSTPVLPKYFPLIRGKLLEEELSEAREFFKVTTPRINLTLSFDWWKESMITLTQDKNGLEPHKKCRMKLKWLSEHELPVKTEAEQFVNLDIFPEGSQMTFNESGENHKFHISRGLDIISIEYLTI
jgi:hypothetical protein